MAQVVSISEQKSATVSAIRKTGVIENTSRETFSLQRLFLTVSFLIVL
jgi:hypothetical protein